MDTLTDAQGGQIGIHFQGVSGVSDAETFTFSLSILEEANDPGGFPGVALLYTGGTQLFSTVKFDKSTGAYVVDEVPAQVENEAVVVEDHDAHYRVHITGTNNSTGNTSVQGRINGSCDTVFDAGAIVASAIGDVTVWGASMSQTPYGVPYAKTTAGAVTVNADVLTGTYPVASEGTLVIGARAPLGVAAAASILLRIDDGTASTNQLEIQRQTDRTVRFLIEGGGGGDITADSVGTWADGADANIAVAWSEVANKIQISLDNETPVETAYTNAFSATVSRMFVGCDEDSLNHIDGTIKFIEHWPFARFGADLQAA